MGSVEVFTKPRMQAIEDGTVTTGEVDSGGDLILTRHDGSHVNAGHVKGADGADATALLTTTDTTTVKITKTGLGTPASPWNIKADVNDLRGAVEKTTLKTTVMDANTNRWYVIGADGVTYGPYRYDGAGILRPGDDVWVVKDSNGVYTIAGYKGTTRSLEPFMAATSISYQRGWGDNNWEEPSYTIRNGIVQLNGLLATSDATAFSKVLMTLPPEARPDTDMLMFVDRSGGGGALYVNADGTVKMEAGFLANSYISLSRIMYPQAGRATWTTFPASYYVNGWSDFQPVGPSFGPARYWVDEYGYVWLAGMIRAGSMGSIAMNLPAGHPILSDSKSGHIATSASGSMGFIYSPNNTGRTLIVGAAGTNTWVSLFGCGWPSGSAIAATQWTTGYYPVGAGGGRDSTFMVNGWLHYDINETSWSKFKIAQRPDGMVMTRGLIAAGSFGSGNAFVQMRDEWSRKKSIIIPTVSNNAYARIDLQGREFAAGAVGLRNFIVLNSGAAVWFSMDGVKWFPE